MSARALAAELEVSERTVYRDVDALSAAGIPVFCERGPRGGIALSDGYRTAFTHLAEEEVRALFISAANPLADLGLGDGLRKTLQKLAGALPRDQRASAERVRDRIHLDPTRWKQAAQPREHLASLQRAIWDDRCIRLWYRDRDGVESDRVVEPLGLVAKAGIWYLVARSKDEMRVFRATRILRVERMEERFTRPEGFSLDRFWEQWSSDVEARASTYAVVLRATSPAVANLASWFGDSIEVLAPADAHGWQTIRVGFQAAGEALGHVLAFGGNVEALEPPEFRQRVIVSARATLARHAYPTLEKGRSSA